MAKYYLDDTYELYGITSLNTNHNLIQDTQMTATGNYRRDNLNIIPLREFNLTTKNLTRAEINTLITYINNTFGLIHSLKLAYKNENIDVIITDIRENIANSNYHYNSSGDWEDTAGQLTITLKEKGVVV
jgi:hypothetical protein